MNDVTERIEKLLLKKDARAAGITKPVTISISLQAALRGGFDREMEDAAYAGRRAALVLVSGSIDRRGMVQVWAEKARPLKNGARDYAATGVEPNLNAYKGGKSPNRTSFKCRMQTNLNHA